MSDDSVYVWADNLKLSDASKIDRNFTITINVPATGVRRVMSDNTIVYDADNPENEGKTIEFD